MNKFVPDHHADAAIINRAFLGSEKGRLQNSTGKVYDFGLGIFVRIHREWCHLPFGAICGGADFTDPMLEFESGGSL